MQWSDEGLVLGARKHGEAGVILELLTRERGRHLGLVHGGRSQRLRPVLQPGNRVQATWRARLDEHLGSLAVEGTELRAARFIGSPQALYGVGALAALLRLLPERDPHPALYDKASVLADHLDRPPIAAALFVRFELALLAELGFGLDLGRCAATGRAEDLAYVSPRTGRAVGAAAGAPYRDRLLPLPAFLVGSPGGPAPDLAELAAGFELTGFFLRTHLFEPRGARLPEERARFVALSTALPSGQHP
jgi:DNA repair protein RecO (recombination protein O)